jgi:SAM-dependent methyltransferase
VLVRELDAERLDGVGEAEYDCVIMIALIEHLIDPIQAMRAAHRVLRPGGFVYLDTPNLAKWSRRLKLLAGYFPSTAASDEGLTTYQGGPVDLYDEGHLHYFTNRSLGRLLTRYAGFERVEHVGYWQGATGLTARLGRPLASRWPGLFSETVCIGYKG